MKNREGEKSSFDQPFFARFFFLAGSLLFLFWLLSLVLGLSGRDNFSRSGQFQSKKANDFYDLNLNKGKNLPSQNPARMTITDSLGRQVQIPEKVERIISLQPEISRIIVALGGGQHLVGLDRFLRFEDHLFFLIYPPARQLPLIALSDESINAETILRFRPEIVFVSPSEPSLAEALSRKLSLPVCALSSQGQFKLLLQEMLVVGQAIGREARARKLVAFFQDKLGWLEKLIAKEAKREKPQVYLAFWSSLVMTPVSYDPVKAAGGLNLAEGLIPSYLGTARTVVSLEQILRWNPEIILIHGNYRPAEREITCEKILNDRRLSSVEAVKKKQVYYTFGFWYWWDPAQALFETFYLAALFYPELRSRIDLKAVGEEIFAQFYNSPQAFWRLLEILEIELPAGPGTSIANYGPDSFSDNQGRLF